MKLKDRFVQKKMTIYHIAIIHGLLNGVLCNIFIWLLLWANLITNQSRFDWSLNAFYVFMIAISIGNAALTALCLKNTNYLLKVAFITIGLLSFLITLATVFLFSAYIKPLDLPPEDFGGGMLILLTLYLYCISYLGSFILGIIISIILQKKQKSE